MFSFGDFNILAFAPSDFLKFKGSKFKDLAHTLVISIGIALTSSTTIIESRI